jgi:hypothetical protein
MPENEDNVRTMWSEDELDQALAALHPAGSPDERSFARMRTEVLVAAGADVPVHQEPPARPRRRWAWWAAATGTVAAVVASVLVVQTVQFENTVPSARAVAQLNSAADRINSVDEPLGPGQYRYIATHAWWMVSIDQEYAYLAENLLETWVPADQAQEWLWRRDVTGARKWIAGSEEQARNDGYPIDEAGWPEGEWRAPCGDWFAQEEGRQPCATPGSWQTPNEEFMVSLPRDPDQLYDRLRRDTKGHGSDEDLEMLVYVADLLRSGLVPADLRAALYRVLAKVSGLQITEQVANLDGQKGTAYGLSAAGTRHDVIIDPVTGQFIGEREVTEDDTDNIPAGTVMDYTSVTTAVVNGMGDKP